MLYGWRVCINHAPAVLASVWTMHRPYWLHRLNTVYMAILYIKQGAVKLSKMLMTEKHAPSPSAATANTYASAVELLKLLLRYNLAAFPVDYDRSMVHTLDGVAGSWFIRTTDDGYQSPSNPVTCVGLIVTDHRQNGGEAVIIKQRRPQHNVFNFSSVFVALVRVVSKYSFRKASCLELPNNSTTWFADSSCLTMNLATRRPILPSRTEPRKTIVFKLPLPVAIPATIRAHSIG